MTGKNIVGLDSAGLHYVRWWVAIGACLVVAVVYLSLANISLPQVPSTVGDKINHLVAYGALTGWFGQLLRTQKTRSVMAVCFVLLGILMEWLQGLMGYRIFDWLDAFANTLGVVVGLLLLYAGADKILPWFERRYLRRN